MAAGLAFAGGRLRPGAFDAAAVARALALPLLLFGLAAAGLLCGGSPSPALAQGGNEEPRPTATPTPPVPKYRDILVAYLTDPDERLGPVSASVPRGRVSFRMVPPRDEWQLQFYNVTTKGPQPVLPDTGWECIRETTNAQYYFQYALDSAHGRGLVATWNELNNVTHYLRAVVTKDGESACAKARDAYGQLSRPNSDMAVITRTLKLTYGTGSHWNHGIRQAPKSFANAPTLRTVDDLIYQSPGGHWTTQMLVSFGAAVVVMIILRSMVGLMLGILLLPVTAYGMVLIGYGSYWYVLVMVLLFVFSVVAWGMAIRRA